MVDDDTRRVFLCCAFCESRGCFLVRRLLPPLLGVLIWLNRALLVLPGLPNNGLFGFRRSVPIAETGTALDLLGSASVGILSGFDCPGLPLKNDRALLPYCPGLGLLPYVEPKVPILGDCAFF